MRRPFVSSRTPSDRDHDASAVVAELVRLTGLRSWAWAEGAGST